MDSKEITQQEYGQELDLVEDHLIVANSDLYHKIRGAVVEKKLWGTKDIWPTTDIKTSRHNAVAQLRPDPRSILSESELAEWQERVAKYVLKLSDLTADILDVVCTSWLEANPNSSDVMILLKASDFLKFRGLQSRAKSGGFEGKRKREVAEQIAVLSNLWIEVLNQPQDSKREKFFRSTVLSVSSVLGEKDEYGSEMVYAWRVRPGDVFMPFLLGPGRVLAPLSKIALEFDPYRQKLQKRLTRYMTWVWRIQRLSGTFLQPFRVATLLEGTKEEVDNYNPLKTKEKFESALNDLKEHKVIADWQYSPGTDYSIEGTRGWIKTWLKWKVEIEPPSTVVDYYYPETMISSPKNKKVEKLPAGLDPIVKELKKYRRLKNLTQTQMADRLEISSVYLSKIERGEKKLSKKMSAIIQTLLKTSTSPESKKSISSFGFDLS